MSKELKTPIFGDIPIGTKFIGFPIDGDNSGHGGYMGAYHVFVKTDDEHATNIKYGHSSIYPKSMKILIVNI